MAAAVLAIGVPAARAQDSKSASIVKEFVSLAGPEMRYVAAKVPDKPDEFVAGLHIPGVQLLVIQARYEHPKFLEEMLGKKDPQGVYTDLNSASYAVAASRIFFEDLKADGFYPKRVDDNAPFDMYEAGGKRIMFDGDWKKAKFAGEKEYMDAFATADERYTRAVSLLVAQLKKGS